MTALTAPLDPATFDAEPEPEFWRTMLAHNVDRIVADVSAGLDWSEPTYRTEPFAAHVCGTCGATGDEPCRYPSGKARRLYHVKRG